MAKSHMKTGVKISNPLTLPVVVTVKSATGALRMGDGIEIRRTLKPGETLYISTKGRAELDIDVKILRFDQVGNSKILGDGGWAVFAKAREKALDITEKPKEPKEPGETEEPSLRSLGDMLEEMKKKEEEAVKV